MNLKEHLLDCIRVCLLEEPNLNGIKRTVCLCNLGNKPVLGLILLSFGVSLFLLSFFIFVIQEGR